jgi:hypothetical protein
MWFMGIIFAFQGEIIRVARKLDLKTSAYRKFGLWNA